MTKTEATRQARRQIRFGYYQPDDTTTCTIMCPKCRQRQTAYVMAWAKAGERCKALVSTLTEHLREEH